jgi:uncharacterized LabA/DUF88 family protein
LLNTVFAVDKLFMANKSCVVVVDNSNIFIEGKKFSAKQKGIYKASPFDLDPIDPSWRIDFGNLLLTVSEGRIVEKAILVGSRPPQSDTVWKKAETQGFDVTVHNRSSSNEEKAVDTELVAQGTELICTLSSPMDLILLSGDGDFVPLVSVAHRRKWSVEMWAFTNSYRHDGALATCVDHIKPLDNVFGKIGWYA